MMVAMSFSIESTGASERAVRLLVPGSWMEVEGGLSSMPLSLTFCRKESEKQERCYTGKKVHGGSGYFHHTRDDPDLLSFLIRSRWDDVALVTREVFRECFQDLGVSLGGRFMVTWKGIRKKTSQTKKLKSKVSKGPTETDSFQANNEFLFKETSLRSGDSTPHHTGL